MLKKIIFFIYLALSLGWVSAKCNMPVPDTDLGVYIPKRNVAGHFLSIENEELIIYSIDEHKNVRVSVKRVKVAYSAFGGDEDISKLKKGILMRIWYVGCRMPKKGLPVAAYIEFFSADPLDIPSESYLKKNGR
ncbi:hypothetical protein D3C72_1284200 [compost metagenome]